MDIAQQCQKRWPKTHAETIVHKTGSPLLKTTANPGLLLILLVAGVTPLVQPAFHKDERDHQAHLVSR